MVCVVVREGGGDKLLIYVFLICDYYVFDIYFLGSKGSLGIVFLTIVGCY